MKKIFLVITPTIICSCNGVNHYETNEHAKDKSLVDLFDQNIKILPLNLQSNTEYREKMRKFLQYFDDSFQNLGFESDVISLRVQEVFD